MHRKMKKKIISVYMMWLMLCMAAGCGKAASEEDNIIIVEQEEEEEEDFDLAVVTRRDLIQTVVVRSQYKAAHMELLSFHVDGELIHEVYVKEGDEVVRGQLLASLSAEGIEDEIEKLEYEIARTQLLLDQVLAAKQADIDYAELEYSYTHQWYMEKEAHEERLAEIEESYAYEIEDYEDSLYIANLRLADLQAQLSTGKLYAGISGTVVYVMPDLQGSITEADKHIFTITNSDECFFVADYPEDAVYFEEGVPVTLEVSMGTSAGTYEVLPKFTADGGLAFVLVDEESAQIQLGAKGMITIVLENRQDVLCVPPDALNSADDRYYVYVMDENNCQQVKWVEIGLQNRDYVEIISGLEEGDKVILR